jgi:hypothetical protein
MAPGKIVLFMLPEGLDTASEILARIDGNHWSGHEEMAERELKKRINEHIRTLPYPPAALILPEGKVDEECGSLLTVCAILSKSSAHVYLASKNPNLGYLTPGREVRMFIPDAWRLLR